ncbi:hypothetical protein TELCIR_09797 [Teladorsagia circumcincta]|uniref:Uncharacterized protein n=1 Tax=Teladorsagia circumcincta TaxID=45464 RepID=A0A2G9UDU9_TELCI|nr:hypothetical protein TELCIR_09797 [Teladorsagia circumcincta]
MKCVALFVAPAMVAFFVRDEKRHDQWRYVYWINGVLLILANAVFLPVATDKPASFTLITRRTKDAHEASAVEMETSARSRKKYSEPYN